MDKKIKLEMNSNKDIVISVNGEKKILINKDDRKISADEIFELLSYSKGDIFSFEVVNEKDYDSPVIGFFHDLLVDITNKINI
ncbi:MAG: hypothetical protein ACPKMZ_11200 [Pleomorphochaeta sp.]